MKQSLLFALVILLCYKLTEAQHLPTFADLPGPEHVLVVYNIQSDTSGFIKDYYKTARNISASNIVPLNLPDTGFYSGDRVILTQEGEVIKRDATCSDDVSGSVCDNLAWQYFEDYIAAPIRTHLNIFNSATGKYFYEQIRYIVLCKGVPLKIQSGHAKTEGFHSNLINISVNSLLSLINNNGNNNHSPIALYGETKVSNPYYNSDNFYTTDYRFIPNYFKTKHQSFQDSISLAYLVTRLDGLNYSEIAANIDRMIDPDTSGTAQWILDGGGPYGTDDMSKAHLILQSLGFNSVFDNTSAHILNSPTNDLVIGYSSAGKHAGLDTNYAQSQLQFNYANGSIFNTYESYNGYSMDPKYRRKVDLHGLLTEFLQRRGNGQGGTSGVGHVFEPGLAGVMYN